MRGIRLPKQNLKISIWNPATRTTFGCEQSALTINGGRRSICEPGPPANSDSVGASRIRARHMPGHFTACTRSGAF